MFYWQIFRFWWLSSGVIELYNAKVYVRFYNGFSELPANKVANSKIYLVKAVAKIYNISTETES